MLIPIGLLIALGAAPARQAPQDAGDPSGRVARLALLEGPVSFQPSGDTAWSDAPVNYVLTSGDRLYAGDDARAELQVGDVTVRIGPHSDLTVVHLTDDFLQVALASGVLRAAVYDLSGGDSIEVDTPNGALMLRAAGDYRIEIGDGGSATVVTVDSGVVDVFTGEAVQSVGTGRALRLDGVGPTRISSVRPAAPDDFDRWSAQRDRPLADSPSARYVGTDVAGYADLDRTGTWESVPVYGWVWYPTVVGATWAPYVYGHWAWVEPWGWTWIDDAAWGWAPFHYGRWVVWGGRWVWVPGPYVRRHCYAPALVVFVTFGRVGVQGWFPLGPREYYHPWYHHGPGYRGRVNPGGIEPRERDVVYVNRPHVVAMPADAFRGSEPVTRRRVPVSNVEVRRAVVVPHPPIQPMPRAAAGGPPATRAPDVRRPEVRVVPRRAPAPAAQPAQPERPAPGRPVTPRPREEARPVQPVPKPEIQRPIQPRPPEQPRPAQPSIQPPAPRRAPPVVVKNPPPPEPLPFPVREKAMQQDPGRPLEPAQRQNLREGKPAGPPRDVQTPPDRRAAPAARPAPPAKPAPKPAPPKQKPNR